MKNLYICKAYNNGIYLYGFGLSEAEAINDAKIQFQNKNISAFSGNVYKEKVINKTYVPIPSKWKSTWGLCWIYWLFHWLAVNYIAITKFKKIFPFHDIDKPIKRTLGVPYSYISYTHHKYAKHHCKFNDPKVVNWIEAICDWEASAFSKPKHQLSALGNWYFNLKKDYKEYILPLLIKGNLL